MGPSPAFPEGRAAGRAGGPEAAGEAPWARGRKLGEAPAALDLGGTLGEAPVC